MTVIKKEKKKTVKKKKKKGNWNGVATSTVSHQDLFELIGGEAAKS